MTSRKWSCMCGKFEGEVSGDPSLACWCYCESCRKQTGAPMQLAVFDNLKVLKGDDNLIAFKKNPDSAVTRKSCKDCGSFCYKLLGEGGPNVVPVGALSDEYIKPTCNIFVADKGNHPVLDSSLACHDGFP